MGPMTGMHRTHGFPAVILIRLAQCRGPGYSGVEKIRPQRMPVRNAKGIRLLRSKL